MDRMRLLSDRETTLRPTGPRRIRRGSALVAAGLGIASFAVACAIPMAKESADLPRGYSPGLGEIMSATQMRHLKLWFAGQAGNWPLAAYEVDELEEGFAEAVRFHPEHKASPRPLTELVPEFTTGPIEMLRKAIAQEDFPSFEAAHDALTRSCNACHAATGFSFNVVRRPVDNPYGNQDFGVP